jgi:hypothetical protein
MKEAVEELRSYFEWSNNWDHEGAVKPKVEAIKDAMRFQGKIVYFMIIDNERVKGITSFGGLNVPSLKDKQKTPPPNLRDIYGV